MGPIEAVQPRDMARLSSVSSMASSACRASASGHRFCINSSHLNTHTVLDAAGSSIPGCGDPRSFFRRHRRLLPSWSSYFVPTSRHPFISSLLLLSSHADDLINISNS
ncbi:hypothetical protein CFAM422_000720 [Trichoderma lentiforme]|uniref:Uncharacterized protein n=1 Tax=Trichoderma lentiforme TaxID=1567552 RepID=A0A9P5CJF3_9HYPO|nr:hypothetical protein CFAM422_000720 [Trichoderma lentiforme]